MACAFGAQVFAQMPKTEQSLRLASFHVDLSRRGPGDLLAAFQKGDDPQITAAGAVIAQADADILVLQGMDWDLGGLALRALADHLGGLGLSYPYLRAFEPNAGRQIGMDFDNDGRFGEPEDAAGHGWFRGEGGMAILSRLPLGAVYDATPFLWQDLPQSQAPRHLNPHALARAPLFSVGAVIVEVPATTAHGALHLYLTHTGPPAFDDGTGRNVARNGDEIGFWSRYLDGWHPPELPRHGGGAFVLAGTLNQDPARGSGQRAALRGLLDHPALRHVTPFDANGQSATAYWDAPLGALRVDYILPARDLAVQGSGMISQMPQAGVIEAASRHRLIWVDIALR